MFSWRTSGQPLTSVKDLYLTSAGFYVILKPKAAGDQDEPRPVLGYMNQMGFFRKGRAVWNSGGEGGYNQVRGDLQITPLVPIKDAQGNATGEKVGGYLRGTFLNSDVRNPITADLKVYRTDYRASLASRASNLDLGGVNRTAVVHNSDKAYVVSGPQVNGFFRRLSDLQFFAQTRPVQQYVGVAPGAPDYSSSAANSSLNAEASTLRNQATSTAYDYAMSHPGGCWLFFHTGKLGWWFTGEDNANPTSFDLAMAPVGIAPDRPPPGPSGLTQPKQVYTQYIERVIPIALLGDTALLTVITTELRPNPNRNPALGNRYALFARAYSVRVKAGAVVSTAVTGYAGRNWVLRNPQPPPGDFNYDPEYGIYDPGPVESGGTLTTAGMATADGEYLETFPWNRSIASQNTQAYYLVEVTPKFWLRMTLQGTGITSVRWFWSKDKGATWTPFPASFNTSLATDLLAGAGQSAVKKDLKFPPAIRKLMKAKETTL